MRPRVRRLAAHFLVDQFEVSARRASRVLGLSWSTMTYKSVPSKDGPLEEEMKRLATQRRRFGLPRIYYFLNRDGFVRSKSRTERVYRKLGLQIKNRRRKKMAAVTRTKFAKAESPNEIWSFDFVSDRLESNRVLKCLTIVDDCSKRSPGILTAHSITSMDLTDFMDSLKKLPTKLRCDNGPEMTSRHFLNWAHNRKIEIEFIQPGKPIQNAFIESFNSRFRDECLNEEIFLDLEDAKSRIEKWRRDYNEERPHTSLGFKTPEQFEDEF